MDRPRLTAGRQTCAHCRNQPIAQVARCPLEPVDDGLADAVIGQQVPARSHIAPLGLRPDAQGIRPRMDRRIARLIDRQNLSVLDEPALLLNARDGLSRRGATLHQVQGQRAKRRVGHILRGHRPNPGARKRTACGNRRRRRRDRNAKHARICAARHQRERHIFLLLQISSGVNAPQEQRGQTAPCPVSRELLRSRRSRPAIRDGQAPVRPDRWTPDAHL
ncbi:hypothetical protein TRL7639_04567 [Falsiruegeria litorea R37]|uniref:Uncharacterized protein n=1 Tax=Falsiruegeria litorea R37 TaxID=1200284 RepID=A0A1Y5TZC3_9RHOB|nr:hypothetical protein TRL7639_04567 [Falsiruegeria litorea R37]